MKTLKHIDFNFDLIYQVKEITHIKIEYRGSITLSFASRKKDMVFSATASGSEIVPELFSTLSHLDRDQYNELQEILCHSNLIERMERFIAENNFPLKINGYITKENDHLIFEVGKERN